MNKKLKVLIVILLIAGIGVGLFFLLRSCSDDTPDHIHKYVGAYDSENHWTQCKCGEIEMEKAAHVDENDDLVCDVCQYELTPVIDNAPEIITEFSSAMSGTRPSKINGSIELTVAGEKLDGTFNVIFGDSGSFTVEYSYKKFNTTENGGADDAYETVTNTVTYTKDSGFVDNVSGPIDVTARATTASVKLSDETKYTIIEGNSEAGILRIKIAAANTKAVLGADYGADVTLQLTKGAGKITSYVIEYDGAKVVCNYN